MGIKIQLITNMPRHFLSKILIYSSLLTYACTLAIALNQPTHSPSLYLADQTNPTSFEAQHFGFSLNLHHTNQISRYIKAIDQIKEMGFTSIQILTPAFQTHGGSTEITLPQGPSRSPSRKDLLHVLKYAHRRGLRTALMPTILFTNPRGNEWRGKISPDNWPKWWRSYQHIMAYFTQIAQESHTDMLSIGSELLSTEKQLTAWTTLIKQIRKNYHGKLIYSTNWDHYHVPVFWNQIDFVGISGYWDITTLGSTDSPADPLLYQRWMQIQKNILDFARLKNKPVIITELGYPSLPWALKDPWNYIADQTIKATPKIQAKGYAAFLHAWETILTSPPRTTPFAGVFFYAWDPYRNGDAHDTGYGINGKPAKQIFQQWFKQHATAPLANNNTR